MRRRMLFGVSILLLVAVVVGARFLMSDTKAHAREPGAAAGPPAVQVLVASAEKRDVPIWLEGLGTVTAWQQVTVKSQVDGVLSQVTFREGQPVKAGDVLATIDQRPFLVQLHQAEGALARDEATLRNGKKNLERYQKL